MSHELATRGLARPACLGESGHGRPEGTLQPGAAALEQAPDQQVGAAPGPAELARARELERSEGLVRLGCLAPGHREPARFAARRGVALFALTFEQLGQRRAGSPTVLVAGRLPEGGRRT